jgi:hypothetical protein
MTATYVTCLIRDQFGVWTAAPEKPVLIHTHGQGTLCSQDFRKKARRYSQYVLFRGYYPSEEVATDLWNWKGPWI